MTRRTSLKFYSFITLIMTQEIIIHAPEFHNESDYIHTEIESNLMGKLDAYIRRTAKEDDKIRTELTLTRDKIGITGKLEVSFP